MIVNVKRASEAGACVRPDALIEREDVDVHPGRLCHGIENSGGHILALQLLHIAKPALDRLTDIGAHWDTNSALTAPGSTRVTLMPSLPISRRSDSAMALAACLVPE